MMKPRDRAPRSADDDEQRGRGGHRHRGRARRASTVAGKTGTAEIDRRCDINQLWFIAFAPAHDPTVAIAVTIEASTGYGGDVAAPIAKHVMQELLQ